MSNGVSHEDDYNHLYKSSCLLIRIVVTCIVVLVGDAGVGKTHLLNR